jgi:Cytidylyltransferase
MSAAVAIIPARGGGKRIPRKNIREFHGKPIIAYSIEIAHRSQDLEPAYHDAGQFYWGRTSAFRERREMFSPESGAGHFAARAGARYRHARRLGERGTRLRGPASRGKPPPVKVVIRVDASRQMGTGHLMRCLALADGLAKKAASCLFVCRSIDEFLEREVRRHGHDLRLLPPGGADEVTQSDFLPYASWLGAHWADDAEATRRVIASTEADWLITDHYGIDSR